MVLTNTPFNGSNFRGWSRNVKMALGAKLKLGFIDGSCLRPGLMCRCIEWIDVDYLILLVGFSIPWLLNCQRLFSMHNLLMNCSKKLEKGMAKFIERDSNSKLIQFLMKLSDGYESVRSQILAMDPLPSVNKAYYIVQQIEKQKQVMNHVFEPTAFCANMNNKDGNSSRRDVKTRRNDSRHEVKRLCTHCNQEGHTVDQCIEKIGYLNWYKGKKAKKSTRIAAHVNSRFDEHFHCDTPFDMGSENEVGFGQNGGVDQKLVAAVCQEMMKMFKGKGIVEDKNYAGTSHAVGKLIQTNNLSAHFYPNDFMFQDPSTKEIVAVGKGSRCLYICKPTTDQVTFSNSVSEFSNSHKQLSPTVCFNKDAYSNSMYKQSVDVHIFHARLGHTSVSKLIHIPVCNSMDLSKFSCECCMLSKSHRLPFQLSNSMSERAFELLHMDLWGPYKQPALNGAHYFFTIVDDPEPHGLSCYYFFFGLCGNIFLD
ncbi:retrovirus-related pol polyprotein from transposon TNT 1-94 [Tanacetum coccineum]